ncbi:hypothetical protein EYC87_01950 [Halieaceae bacterium IMCC8485]|uniref:IPTL-CTERM protein sorting domain-containing protein n=1 Tax=Candidatus Seongchinamella marina TaxID=2518990 RepID=A0ABT3SRS7_9GAMM|nr:choice-of-anchor Q domain-containing protein [Candidatus Seongchinamella marina]MCX2972350.1 hypothetical protein [Candidatus Seongchinamella marina]
MNIKKRLLSLAVANVSLSLAAESLAAGVTGTGAIDCADSLQQALNDVDSVLGETVVIDVANCPEISLSGTITVANKPVIIQAPVAADGRPQVVINAASDGFGLFSFENSSSDPDESHPIIISGLELSGAASNGPGGAINANNHILVLDKSVISENSAVGAGGGIYVAGELCLQGSELIDNTVTHVFDVDGFSVFESASAVGGGAAVNGSTLVKPSFAADFEFPGNTPPDDCLTGTGAEAIFTAVSAGFNESAAALAGNHPAGMNIIASKITGNSALVDLDISELEYGPSEDAGVAALGGGIASFGDGVARDNSISAGSKYGEGSGGLSLWQAVIADNAATVTFTNNSELLAPKYVVSAGGGVFAGIDSAMDDTSTFIESKYVEVRDNTVSLTGSGARRALAMGGGLAASESDVLRNLSAGWLDSLGGGEGYSESGVFSSLSSSEVSGNTVELSMSDYAEGGNNAQIAVGGGVAVVGTNYSESLLLLSLASTVSGNTVVVSGGTNDYSEAYTHAAGGGLAVGNLIFDADAPSRIAGLKYGRYYGYGSGNSGNTVSVSSITDAGVGGGGVSANFTLIGAKKPEFELAVDPVDVTSEQDGFAIPVAVLTDPGGVTNNSVELTNTSGGEQFLTGGGLWAGSKYSVAVLSGASITGNEISANKSAGGLIQAVGGGVGQRLKYGEGFLALYSEGSNISDNSITISGATDSSALGGGIGLSTQPSSKGSEYADAESNLRVIGSTVSGNMIDISVGAEYSSEAAGGGIFADNIGNKYAEGETSVTTVVASTIASNQLFIATAEGDVPTGAGLFLEAREPSEDDEGQSALGVLDTTVVGNTSSVNGVANGGQVFLDAKYLNIINTLISGNEAQGVDDLYVGYGEIVGNGSAVFHGGVPSDSGFLPSELANPDDLGPLQFNGSALLDDDDPKYGFFAAVKTIALLEGSGAIDPEIPTETNLVCATEVTDFPDQRGYPRDSCSDIGAYEWSAERDGDGLVDDAELAAPATDPEIFLRRQQYSSPLDAYIIAPNDGNSDGIPDVDQNSVASFSSDTSQYTLAVVDEEGNPAGSSSYSLTGISTLPAMAEPIQVEGGAYVTLTGVSFTAVPGSGDPSKVNLELITPASFSGLALIKQQCNLLEDGEEPALLVLDDSPDAFGDSRVQFLFELNENGPEDCNGEDANISDPAYIARFVPSVPTPVPVMPWLVTVLMSGMVSLLGMFGLRRRRDRDR